MQIQQKAVYCPSTSNNFRTGFLFCIQTHGLQGVASAPLPCRTWMVMGLSKVISTLIEAISIITLTISPVAKLYTNLKDHGTSK